MTYSTYHEGALAFQSDKNCGFLKDIGDLVLTWASLPTIDREWLKGYMDGLIDYMQVNNLSGI